MWSALFRLGPTQHVNWPGLLLSSSSLSLVGSISLLLPILRSSFSFPPGAIHKTWLSYSSLSLHLNVWINFISLLFMFALIVCCCIPIFALIKIPAIQWFRVPFRHFQSFKWYCICKTGKSPCHKWVQICVCVCAFVPYSQLWRLTRFFFVGRKNNNKQSMRN